MANLEWILLGTFIGSLVLLILGLVFLFLVILDGKNIKKIKKSKKSRKKSKQKARANELNKLQKKKKKSRIAFIICLIFSILLGGAAGYITYYQSVNLSQKDSESVVEAYYLLIDFEKELKDVQNGKIDEKKFVDMARQQSSRMASFNSKRASELNKEEGQILLNRYYNVVKEIGVNSSSQLQDFTNDKELVEEFLKDINKAKTYQKDVFKFYKVDEKTLEKQA
ncbi:hypothetical protein [Vagococcus carniphilus]|uniref:hypothetical protein n=1 Tax=Vagococcus carniphilus TaxID=218144 RepID=UPI003B59604D